MSPSMTPGLSPTSSRFHRVRRQDVAQSPAVGSETSGTEPGNGNGSAGTTTTLAGDGGAGSQPATSTSAPVPETTSPAAQPEGSTTTTTLNPIEATGTTAAATTTVANQFTTTSSVPDQAAITTTSSSAGVVIPTSSAPTSATTLPVGASNTLPDASQMFTDGSGRLSTQTSVSSSSSALPGYKSADNGGSSSSNTGRTWGIVGGVAGGVILVTLIIWVIYRCTQRRFEALDDVHDDIKWPELQPDGQEVSASTSTINPLGTRPTGKAGVGDDDGSEDGHGARAMSGAGRLSMGGNSLCHARQASYEQLGMIDSSMYATAPNYDPYLGQSAAPYPAPQNIYPPPPLGGHNGSPAPTYYSPRSEYQESCQAGSGSQYDSPPRSEQQHSSADLYRGNSGRSVYSTPDDNVEHLHGNFSGSASGYGTMPLQHQLDPFAAPGARPVSPVDIRRGTTSPQPSLMKEPRYGTRGPL